MNTTHQGLPKFCVTQIAQELDALERKFMAESGMESEDYRNFLAEDSGNVSTDGFFSIQVSHQVVIAPAQVPLTHVSACKPS